MRETVVLALVLLASSVQAVDPADPKTLDVSAEKTEEASALIAKLDDDDILVRDRTTEKLKAMGRDALPAMETSLKAKPANRVMDRLVEVLPAARKADFDAGAKCFLADKERKFDHTLPGWNELKAAVKDTKESRLLFADILGDDECREMLVLAQDTTSAGRQRFARRWREKAKGWSAEDRADLLAGRPRRQRPLADGPIHWMPAALLADLVHIRDYQDDSRHHVVLMYLGTDEGKLATAGKGRYGEVVRAFATDWVSRQDGRWGMRDAHLVAFYLKLDETVLREVLEKQFEVFVTGGQPNASFGQIAQTKDPKYIASFRRLLDSKKVFLAERDGPPRTGGKITEILVKDAALSMCIALSGQNPTEYGFSAEIPADSNHDMRYVPSNYFFEEGDGKTADDKRTAAFKKWVEWEKANPDKIKAKPPEKK